MLKIKLCASQKSFFSGAMKESLSCSVLWCHKDQYVFSTLMLLCFLFSVYVSAGAKLTVDIATLILVAICLPKYFGSSHQWLMKTEVNKSWIAWKGKDF